MTILSLGHPWHACHQTAQSPMDTSSSTSFHWPPPLSSNDHQRYANLDRIIEEEDNDDEDKQQQDPSAVLEDAPVEFDREVRRRGSLGRGGPISSSLESRRKAPDHVEVSKVEAKTSGDGRGKRSQGSNFLSVPNRSMFKSQALKTPKDSKAGITPRQTEANNKVTKGLGNSSSPKPHHHQQQPRPASLIISRSLLEDEEEEVEEPPEALLSMGKNGGNVSVTPFTPNHPTPLASTYLPSSCRANDYIMSTISPVGSIQPSSNGIDTGEGLCNRISEKCFTQHAQWNRAVEEVRRAVRKSVAQKGSASAIELIADLLREGANELYGFWSLSERSLMPMIDLIMGNNNKRIEASVLGKMAGSQSGIDGANLKSDGSDQLTEDEELVPSSSWPLRQWNRFLTLIGMDKPWDSKKTCFVIMDLTFLSISLAYGLYVRYGRPAGSLLGWPLLLARGGAMATLLYSIILFATMSRQLVTFIYEVAEYKPLLYSLSIHVHSAYMLGISIFIHVFGHLIGTVPVFATTKPGILDSVLVCAQPGFKHLLPPLFPISPPCPLTSTPTVLDIFLSTVGWSGIVLILLLGIMSWCSRKKFRWSHYKTFQLIHGASMAFYIILLYVHGSMQLLGHGMPLVVPLVLPICLLYLFLRIRRNFRGLVSITRAESVSSDLLSIDIAAKENFLRRCRPGMYVHVLCPEISWFEWHPFSVANWPALGTGFVRLLVDTKGDWTRQLRQRCEGRPADFPMVKLDGPFCAPAQSIKADFMGVREPKDASVKRKLTRRWWSKQSASTRDLECVTEDDDDDGDIEKGRHESSVSEGEMCDEGGEEVIICIGAGVGITPFLSSLDAMLKKAAVHKASGEQAADVGRKKKVWLYWLTRNAGDFLTGVSILKQLSMAATRMLLKGDTALPGLTEVHLRLHVTAAVGPLQLQKPSTFLFHESLQKIICIQSATAKAPFEHENKHAFTCDIPTLQDTSVVDSEASESTRESTAGSNIPIRFGRPCWVQDFTSITTGDYCQAHKASRAFKTPTRWVYLCGNTRLQADVADACRWVSNETGHKFVLMCEEF